jgi:hypothetical protein
MTTPLLVVGTAFSLANDVVVVPVVDEDINAPEREEEHPSIYHLCTKNSRQKMV